MTFEKEYKPRGDRLFESVDFTKRKRKVRYASLNEAKPLVGNWYTQKNAANERLRILFELDKKREDQLKKEYEALEARRRQQEEETQRRISIKKALAETDYISKKKIQVLPSSPLYYCRNPVTNITRLVLSYNYLET